MAKRWRWNEEKTKTSGGNLNRLCKIAITLIPLLGCPHERTLSASSEVCHARLILFTGHNFQSKALTVKEPERSSQATQHQSSLFYSQKVEWLESIDIVRKKRKKEMLLEFSRSSSRHENYWLMGGRDKWASKHKATLIIHILRSEENIEVTT